MAPGTAGAPVTPQGTVPALAPLAPSVAPGTPGHPCHPARCGPCAGTTRGWHCPLHQGHLGTTLAHSMALSPALGTLGTSCHPAQHHPCPGDTQVWPGTLGGTCHLAQHCPLHQGDPGTALAPLAPCMAPCPGDTQAPMSPSTAQTRHWVHPVSPHTAPSPALVTPTVWHQPHKSPMSGMPRHITAPAPTLAQPQGAPRRATACAPCPQCHRGDALPVVGARRGTCLAAVAQPGPAPGCRRGPRRRAVPGAAVPGQSQPSRSGSRHRGQRSPAARGAPGPGGVRGCQHPPGCRMPGAALALCREKVQGEDVPAPGNPRR